MPITFPVSPVKRQTKKLATTTPEALLQARRFPPSKALSTNEPLLDCKPHHGLLMAVHTAYQEHYPLVLSPDDIWLCIAQGLAQHINLNAEAMRSRLVQHTGQKELVVERHEFYADPAKNDWAGVVAELSSLLQQELGNRVNLFVSNFSTTGTTEKIASQIVMMGAIKKYFSYRVHSMCGIPEITLLGTPEDWANIRQRAEALSEFELDWWLTALRPFLANFEAASQGKVDHKFWETLYKPSNASGGEEVTGWVNALFPYVGSKRNSFAMPPDNNKPLYGFFNTKIDEFPMGLTKVPFIWQWRQKENLIELVGGFLGARQDPDSGAIRPVIGWSMSEPSIEPVFTISNGDTLSPTNRLLSSLEGIATEAAHLKSFSLEMYYCGELRSLKGIEGLAALYGIYLSDCGALQDISSLKGLGLKHLSLSGCNQLKRIDEIASLKSLEYLCLMGCTSLRDLSPLIELSALERLDLRGCGAMPNNKRQEYYTTTDQVKSFQEWLRQNPSC